ncbi:bifunctional 4-hydroxy-2-oxoglutarate aldolase/2-dehydro-3-deoxy-phosphogluconate aldolase [Niabella drilacis]|uniref:2-dehydro-3-deoxyphosphogluconate aldolase / (4S)-4-hydroxy-2-oxoglutarate aldolase n=1 Tax=Niabella drilacis (strain DSM 25811 / CCM 8410 / CCUG 62505 / LMG 26954 / E90) TaxID=1285928 RepID=A0A1G6NBY5_NIADE|nr:bifunctional 4-hydroxy-2-oxoglutarate aldolase/2-dehydro-3-deoxy-phosphogluconate aldolase [Niabella drilacis]SDC65379.1 2-dehydro-3-deoxyphosphogluconate aldolase / (4S)-4-hydroxy-2-oxoglutarate aldolase [Niabella drilacis]
MTVYQQITTHKLIAILRGADPLDVVRIATALYEGGIRLLEITMNSEAPLQAIEQVTHKLGDNMVIGAGTVLSAAMAADAVSAGARFILSPVVDERVILAAKKLGAVSIPGAYTATEIYTAHRAGGDIIKVFPSGSPAYIKDLRAPLPHIPLLPTGGITPENIGAYLKTGAVGFGIGSALVNTKEQITDAYLETLKENARKFIRAMQP